LRGQGSVAVLQRRIGAVAAAGKGAKKSAECVEGVHRASRLGQTLVPWAGVVCGVMQKERVEIETGGL
jgi:hypothetical protein